ncbi:hypothetical protein E0H35_23985 [Rhizobium leguminosarum bv. viciae]|uniref:hypothetical protein n=1 Tax=Rhizobium TaxID=379 RepID=UPI00067F0F6B|nr:hypothetical protein [Rhizobium leguminosarum]MBY5344427.1 hypothetical protein [Rhizobium leguminosarum]NEK46585.1 hypothetical protein [Rhizobium leguminosarum]NKK53019.1 hypothetical protein [Rhizobium leguminosarum bv. viciae]NKL23620.1 hypothetical protein [Rhizobium leguminosarum bv. viciae]NKL57614.1 hypothetical protein [Rhizobium leguminosarum bv. viciae]
MKNGDVDFLEEKKRLLSDLCRARGGVCELRETHMSWLFLGAERVYKLKKAVRYPFLDFSSVARRRYFCFEELRLNRRLAGKTYISVVPICRTADGGLRAGDVGGVGEAIDWVVEMLRLPDRDMLDYRMQSASVESSDIDAVALLLSDFYRSLLSEHVVCEHQVAYMSQQLEGDATVLCREEFGLAQQVSPLLAKAREELAECTSELHRRMRAGWFREGHGDLRPEHVWLGRPLQIIDCLEFNRMMRIVDPYQEVAQLGMECSVAGYPWIADFLTARVAGDLGGKPSERLLQFYTATKALLRARLCMAHLLEKEPREPSKWQPLALRYIGVASRSFRDPE